MSGAYVYILRCADSSFYTGSTRLHPEQRLDQHNAGLDPKAYTYKRRPLELVWCAHCEIVTEALGFERQIKGWSRKKKIALIEDRLEDLPGLSRRKPKP